MASTEEFRQVVVLMPASEMESLHSFVAFSGGEVVSETKPSRRKKAKIQQDSSVREEEDADDFCFRELTLLRQGPSIWVQQSRNKPYWQRFSGSGKGAQKTQYLVFVHLQLFSKFILQPFEMGKINGRNTQRPHSDWTLDKDIIMKFEEVRKVFSGRSHHCCAGPGFVFWRFRVL
ncbi:uncharacterized protein [Montipora foliosa]|uniref:uncharacterized protein n=1 Tax=Montipora foliosa TaxID=591990 RepID=UPI0035F1E87B